MVWKGRLPPATSFGWPRLQGEACTAVLQTHAITRQHQAGAKAHVVALDEADLHALRIGRRQVDGAALDRVAGAEVLGSGRVDQGSALAQVVRVEKLVAADTHGARFGHLGIGVGKGQLHGLDQEMLGLPVVHRVLTQPQVARHPQRHQGRNALPIGRNLVHAVPFETRWRWAPPTLAGRPPDRWRAAPRPRREQRRPARPRSRPGRRPRPGCRQSGAGCGPHPQRQIVRPHWAPGRAAKMPARSRCPAPVPARGPHAPICPPRPRARQKPRSAISMAGASRSAKGSRPKR